MYPPKSNLYYSTALTPIRIYIRSNPSNPKRSGNPSTGILLRQSVKVPFLDKDALALINDETITQVTRHFNKDLLARTLSGSFRLGTISQYRPADSSQIGRFSDSQEGLQREVFTNPSGIYSGDLNGNKLENNKIVGFDDPVAIEYIVNDYCSCSSIGKFSEQRAQLIKNRGNSQLSAYAVYDLPKLRQAIEEILSETDFRKHSQTIIKTVHYGAKDRRWDVEGRMSLSNDRDAVSIWLNNAFVKSTDYNHEEEIRLLLVDPKNIGGLAEDTKELILNDPRIADSIIDHGIF